MLRRILALIVKELVGLWKDPKTRFVILVPPVVQVILFAYAATYDVTQVPLGIWNDDAGMQSAELVRRFAGSPAFHVAASFTSPGAGTRLRWTPRMSRSCCMCRRTSPPIYSPAALRRLSFCSTRGVPIPR